MRVKILNFATHNFLNNQKIQNYFSIKNGLKDIVSLTEDDINKTDFFKKNKAIFSIKKGFGLWIWKPFIILEQLKKLDNKTILFYIDSDYYISGDISPLVDLCKYNNFLLFRGQHYCKNWIKRDCFDLMRCDNCYFYELPLLVAGFNLWINCSQTISFLEKWLSYCENFNIISDNVSSLAELKSFKAHRHDQSILTLLAAKNNIEVFRGPHISSKFLPMKNSNYNVILTSLPRVNNKQEISTIINKIESNKT